MTPTLVRPGNLRASDHRDARRDRPLPSGDPPSLASTSLGQAGAVAVVVDPGVFERLLSGAEDALDRAELAMAREEDDYVPWDQVKAELGLA